MSYPGQGESVPTNTRVLGFVRRGDPLPTIVARYYGDPAQPIAGGAPERIGGLGYFDVWAWRPDAPFRPNQEVQVEAGFAVGSPVVRRFASGAGASTAPPEPSLTAVSAVSTHFVAVSETSGTCGSAQLGSRVGRLMLEGIEAVPAGTIVRLLAVGPAATTTLATGMDAWRIRSMSCGGGPNGCEPWLDLTFNAGERLCLAIELESAQGIRAGRDEVICATVEPEDVAWAVDGVIGRCEPHSPRSDGGSASVADAGPTDGDAETNIDVNTTADGGSTASAAEPSGCTSVSPGATTALALIAALLLARSPRDVRRA